VFKLILFYVFENTLRRSSEPKIFPDAGNKCGFSFHISIGTVPHLIISFGMPPPLLSVYSSYSSGNAADTDDEDRNSIGQTPPPPLRPFDGTSSESDSPQKHGSPPRLRSMKQELNKRPLLRTKLE